MNIFKDKIMMTIVLAVCASIMPQLFFKNGFLLSYLLKIGLESSDVLILLSLPSVLLFFLSIPFAHYADQYGKKKIGVSGILLTIVGFSLLILAGFFSLQTSINFIIGGIVLFSIGLSALLSGWFSLLSPLIPEAIRGSFFGTLRVSWQIFAIGCSFILTFILEKNTSLEAYQLILAFFTCVLVIQIYLYLKIPEVEKTRPEKKSIVRILFGISEVPGYMPFCAYCFLLMLATGAWPVTMGLLEKNVLHFSDDMIVHMGTLLFSGSVLGFYIGGKMVDKFGTKMVFLAVHFLYFLFLFLVILRSIVPVSLMQYFGFLTFGLGLIQAASSIALTSEMIALSPVKNKSVIISVCTSLQWGGAAISGVISGKLIEYGILSKTWEFKGLMLSNYDTLLVFSSVMVFVFIVTLGLIPSVATTKKAQWIPYSSKTL
ncbi:MAG: MFS transporter [Proteobacteria bacterium]|nr:MFS transporter [Pseudomonadota bacterium]MBU1387160.1 MFS transporter [Pseudomonadota bacterium]MBU1541523.1 MFS transporter [Pseudomonadota bacterium]MBU2480910.1 MFS transporter [Pseudomonadota bacterium]